MPQLIQVLPIDIAKGMKHLGMACPVALALRRTFPGKQVAVGNNVVIVGEETCSLPPVATRFIKDYDDGKDVNPFNFAVDF